MKRPMPGTMPGTNCALCGQAEGHSARCSVTRNGVDPELYRVECMLHEQAANAACEYSDEVDRLTEVLGRISAGIFSGRQAADLAMRALHTEGYQGEGEASTRACDCHGGMHHPDECPVLLRDERNRLRARVRELEQGR